MGVGVDVGVGVGVSSMNFGEDGFGCCEVDGLKPVRVGLVFGEAVTRRGFDTVRSESFFVITLMGLPCSCDDEDLNIIRALFSTGLGGFSLFAFDVAIVSVNGVEHDVQTLFTGSITAYSLFWLEMSVVENSSFFFVKGFTGD